MLLLVSIFPHYYFALGGNFKKRLFETKVNMKRTESTLAAVLSLSITKTGSTKIGSKKIEA